MVMQTSKIPHPQFCAWFYCLFACIKAYFCIEKCSNLQFDLQWPGATTLLPLSRLAGMLTVMETHCGWHLCEVHVVSAHIPLVLCAKLLFNAK